MTMRDEIKEDEKKDENDKVTEDSVGVGIS